jgi:signal transduction histidine kinase
MKNFFCFIFFFSLISLGFVAYSQTNLFDYSQEMKQLKSAKQSDTTLINTWLRIAHKISSNRPDSALHFANQALLVADKISWKKGIANSHYESGLALRTIGNYPRSLADQLQALRIYETLKDSLGIGNAITEIATIYWFDKNFNKALEYDKKALVIAENQKDMDKICRTLNNIGVLLYDKKDYKGALEYYFRSLKIAEQLKNKRRVASAYHNIGETYVTLDRLPEGFDYLEKSLAIGRELNDKNFIANTLVVLSATYQKQGNIDASVKYAEKGYEVAKQIGSKEYMKNASNILYSDYKMRHNTERALEYYELYVAYRDSMFNETNHRHMVHLQTSYELEKKQKEIELLASEQKLQQKTNQDQLIISYILLALVCMILMILALFIRANIDKKRTNVKLMQQKLEIEKRGIALAQQQEQIIAQNEKLSKQNEKLTILNSEKDGLVGIVAHDLRAPLNRIKGFSQILSFEENLNEDQIMMLKRIDKTCNAGIALIKDLLIINNIEYESSNITKVNLELGLFLTHFIEQFEHQASAKQIKIHLIKNATIINLETDENFISRILDNIISNAIKFTQQGKNVYVRYEQLGDSIIIAVKDEGQGLSKQDQQKLFIKFQKLSARPTGGEESTGLGLAIVKALVNKLQGEISVVSEVDEGAEFILKLPKKF